MNQVPTCELCGRPISRHTLKRWTVDSPLRAYCGRDYRMESSFDDQDVLDMIAEGEVQPW